MIILLGSVNRELDKMGYSRERGVKITNGMVGRSLLDNQMREGRGRNEEGNGYCIKLMLMRSIGTKARRKVAAGCK